MSEARGGPAPALRAIPKVADPPSEKGAPQAALRLTRLAKTFGGTRALVDVDLEVRSGEIHALVGGNGSGKSSLIKILAGVYQADPGGTLEVAGQEPTPAEGWTPERAFAANMRFVHQNPAVFGDLTVAENIAIGHGFPTAYGRIRWGELRARTRELIDRFGIRGTPDTPLRALNPADRTLVAVARALQDSLSCGLLVLDEPTTALPADDIEVLVVALRRCAARGQTILYVSHRVDEVLALADRVTVLRDGRRVTTRPAAELTEAALVELIAGRVVGSSSTVSSSSAEGPGVALELRGVSAGRLDRIDLRVRRGEILGVAGLLGSGRSTLLRTVFGAVPVRSGSILLDGAPFRPAGPGDAIAAGIAYVPEDRVGDAAFAGMSVRENVSAGGVGAYWRRLRLQHGEERRDAVAAMSSFLVRAGSDQAPLATLSGGNQQKVMLARWLRRQPRVVLLDEPTQGVDVGARAEIYDLIRRSAAAGSAVVVVANDFVELARLCERVVVLVDGRVVAEQLTPSPHRLTELAYRKETPHEH